MLNSSTTRAIAATLLFALFGMWGWALHAGILPLLIYYIVLLINTFFSIRRIAAFTPRNTAQVLFDSMLIIIYALLALTSREVLPFCAVSALLFAVAIAKYAHLERIVDAERIFLARKIKINALGAILSIGCFVIAIGSQSAATWTLAIVFAIANVYLLGINPMYRAS